MIKVGIVAGNMAMRIGLREVINNQPDLEVVAAAMSFDDLPAEGIDVLVVVPPVNRNPAHGALAVLYLTDDPTTLQELFNQNISALGLLSLNSSEAEICIAIHALAEGLWIGAPNLVQNLFPRRTVNGLDENESTNPPLTVRETEVLQLAAQGLANKQIASHLGISEHTIKFHLSSIYTKLSVSSRTEAVRSGVRHGLVVL